MSRYTTFEGYVRFRTGSAVLFESYYWEGPLWFPLSNCYLLEDGDDTWVIKIRNWLTKKNELHELCFVPIERINELNDF